MLKPIFTALQTYGTDDDRRRALIFLVFDTLDEYCRNNDLERGTLLAPDVEVVLWQAGRLSAENDHVGTHRKGSRTVMSKDQMFNEEVLDRLKLKSGRGTSVRDTRLVGSVGVDQWHTPNMHLSPSVKISHMSIRKATFVAAFKDQMIPQPRSNTYEFIKVHTWSIHHWADILFNALDHHGWDNLQSLISDYSNEDRSSFATPVTEGIRRQAIREPITVVREFYESLADAIGFTNGRNASLAFRSAETHARLYHNWLRFIKDMKTEQSAVLFRISHHERVNGVAARGRSYKTRAQLYVVATLGLQLPDFQRRMANAAGYFAIQRLIGDGFFGLLEHHQFMRYELRRSVPDSILTAHTGQPNLTMP